jgi:type I restriction enzyme, S subunit
MNISISQLWKRVPLKELGIWSGGGTPSKSKPHYWQKGTIPWVSPKDMKTERILDSEDHITKEAISHSTASLINAGSVLIVTRSGILRHTLPVAVSSVAVTVNQDLKALTPRNGIMAEYVAWALRAFSRNILNTCSKQGTTVNSIETAKLLRFEIPVAPTEQQHTIVAEIEKQFSRLDEAVASLNRVKANLKRYKAAILKAAVEGKLTEGWRMQHPDVEPASKLLERIVAERRATWKGKYKEPVGPESGNLPLLPKGWTWAVADQLGVVQLGRQRSPKNRSKDHAVRYIRAANITETGLDLSDLLDMEFSQQEQERYRLRRGDLVLSEASGSPKQVGKPAVWQDQLPLCCFQNTVIRLRPAVDLSPYLLTCFRSYYVNGVFAKIAGGVGINHLSAEKFSRVTVPLAPAVEQQQIVAEVERRLSVIDELETAVRANLTRADRLRQSILSQAFTGKLVPVNASQGGRRSTDIQMAKA